MIRDTLGSQKYTVRKHNGSVNLFAKVKKLCELSFERLAKQIDKASEPKITKKFDKAGNDYWLVYDPINDSIFTFNHEDEVRIWLEERYYSFVGN